MVQGRTSVSSTSRIHLAWALLMAGPMRRLLNDLLHPYHPERHYMRGPGPKWREKHPDLAAARH
jgi:hypothetical protein